ncbi:dihydrofolate reductase family protein [Mesorhizobium atlanticum]
MRRLILQMQMSVDGFVGSDEDRRWQLWEWGDDSDWDEELKQDFNAVFTTVDTILLSRRMAQEGYLAHWGNAAKKYPKDPFYAFARRIIEAEKVVASDRLGASRWERTRVVSGDLPPEVDALKQGEGGDIAVFGGAGFASALIAAGTGGRVPAVHQSGGSGQRPPHLRQRRVRRADAPRLEVLCLRHGGEPLRTRAMRGGNRGRAALNQSRSRPS